MHENEPDITTKIPLGFGQLTASVGDHIAHFYKAFHQRLSVLGPYVAEGIRSRRKCAVACGLDVAEQLCEWLDFRGLNPIEAQSAGPLSLFPGAATTEEMKALVDHVESESLEAGYPFVRWAGDMAWGLTAKGPSAEMLRWEAVYDHCAPGWKMCALCQYDLDQFGRDAFMNALHSHPLCIMGEALVPNPLHIPPERLLQELAQRS